MKSKIYLFVPGLFFLLLSNLAKPQTWTSIELLPTNRDVAISFSIGSYGFCGGGGEAQYDFWKYSPAANTWTQLANLPSGGGRGYAVGVSDGKYGYFGFGSDNASDPPQGVQRDWWRYDMATDTWVQKANLPGAGHARGAAGAFVINGKIYLLGGLDSLNNCLNDCWVYDTGADSWKSLPALPDSIAFPACFSVNGKGYFTCYVSKNYFGHEKATTYMYDPIANTWTAVASFPGAARQAGTAFVVGNTAYVGLGQHSYTTLYDDFYSYNAGTNQWNSSGNYGGVARAWPSAFVVNDSGYVGSGSYFSGNNAIPVNNWWKFKPSGLSVNDINDANGFTCYPIPAKDFITIENSGSVSNNGNDKYYIYDINGQLLDAGRLVYTNSKGNINVSELPNGEYVVCLKNNNTLIGTEKITILR